MFVLFFSSRRRHTILQGDWSSDVCSSDLWMAAGGDLAELVQRIPEPAAARIAGAQYYWIRHAHPVALTGHIAVLEWHPPSPALVPDLMDRTSLPRQAFQTLALHAELEAEHGGRLET